MGSGFQLIDIIIFAAIAAFLVLRLRSVLGKRTGHEGEPGGNKMDPFRQGPGQKPGQEAGGDKVIPLPDRARDAAQEAAEDEELGAPEPSMGETSLAGSLTQIKLADRGFEPEGFINGAKMAFEMIIGAFAQGDTRTLRPLLSNDVYEDFSNAIKERETARETLETTLVGIRDAEIIEAELQGKTAFVTVKFVSDQINVTRDAKGEVVDGDPNHVSSNTDIWTFARNTRSRDPNWTLVATGSSN
jgi:predicted lipid-binding transport protein (Tim44 family)